ncbi:MAG: helix-turn-helix domain-containing protein [Candidatus Delongbacteria bacterium]|nr:helix-turn-helix domain-containing protein [Candidatus Delongbacteria bacterium]
MNKLGTLIKQRREKAGLSLKKLGDACGISDSEVMKIENGTRKNPNWVTLCEMAKVLDFHPFELLLAVGYITHEDIHPNAQIHGLDKLSANKIETVQTFIDFIAVHEINRDLSQKEAIQNEL